MTLSRQVEPIYRELADTLRRELSGYRAGDYLPPEVQLASRFSVNRHTIRRAIDELVAEGCLLRLQGKGTQVLERPLIYPMAADSAYSQSLSAQGVGVQALLLRRRHCPASREDARHLELQEQAPLIELQTLRLLDEQPVSLIRHRYCASRARWLDPYNGGSLRQFFADRKLPLTRTFSLIGARLPSRDEAGLLLMPRHMPVLTVLTVSRDPAGRPVELALSTSRSDRFQYQVVT
ncbi:MULTISPECIES: phosphonate metabolism transcriptional regulator PhnF [Pseudomonas]|uniref:Phosphonate metabolism transcriptional regulator PhnF n=3 Tax=Pseudomonas gingeri TaxID=117681 RepID=A0A7Y7XVY8_9PSED|nr:MULTISPECIES: phosphonate metabolism transcriptional regulator PhnF [Pseudomonas]NVZ29661.1 phosphonate metabolism transcriptional regulator PhnF [Pseudomonas gingeri]NVZ65406.1 phosphonate metabolism transcriptional regulator PhnF [Pseudomonas gingeri]NWA08493.1 phosphonate metabolism transcriptional regulator PhnF [Pseudomonas gingeri]NWC12980.1 phosphonate metabolism transcriptional regulator PhnF [Pseudomonas gingeri]NWE46515.1 phosphonate metabolism transcriptional regulator PhnF [Pseu